MLTINHSTAEQTLHVNPTKEERQTTNGSCIIIFGSIVCVWLLIIFTALSDSPTTSLFLGRVFSPEVIYEIYPRFSWEFPLSLILSGLISFFYIYILSQNGARYIVYVGVFLLYCLIGFLVVGTITIAIPRLISNYWAPSILQIIFQLIFLLLIIVCLIASLISAHNVGVEPIFEIIRDACRALMCCPISISIFIFLMSVITIFTFIFSLYIALLVFFTQSNTNIINFYSFLNSYCTMAIMSFLLNFTQLVISGYIMDWFWSKDQNVNTMTIKRSLGRILNYHIGSVAFFSIPLLPTLCSLYQVCRRRDSDGDIVKRYNIFTRFFGQFRVFMSVVDFALIQTSIYGYESKTTIMAAHDLVSQNNHKFYLAVCGISDMLIGFGLCLIAIPFALENILFYVYALFIPFYIVLATTIRTLLVNKMIINYTSDAFKEEYNSVNPGAVL